MKITDEREMHKKSQNKTKHKKTKKDNDKGAQKLQ